MLETLIAEFKELEAENPEQGEFIESYVRMLNKYLEQFEAQIRGEEYEKATEALRGVAQPRTARLMAYVD